MAIARGAGTEIIRSIHLHELDSTTRNLIYGVQHHIYTVLSIITYAVSVNSAGNYMTCLLAGYDSLAGTTNVNHYIFRNDMSAAETYVWNDKFSFNGFEPTDYSGNMDSDADQNLISDQASGVAQVLKMYSEHASDSFDVTCTFIDQNNA